MNVSRRLGMMILGVAFVLGIALRDVSAEKHGHRGRPVELLVPAYFDATDPAWARLAAAARHARRTVILNPNSGPGTQSDPHFLADVAAIQEAGGRVIGYVHTSYGERPLADVKAEIARYLSYYPVNGIFIDEMTNRDDAADYLYYREIYAFIKQNDEDLEVVGNPGAPSVEGYFTHHTVDSLVLFEDTLANYAAYSPPAWTAKYPARRFGNIVYGVPQAALIGVLRRSEQLHAGMVYVTDDTITNENFGNVYERLPVYWDQEVALVARMSVK